MTDELLKKNQELLDRRSALGIGESTTVDTVTVSTVVPSSPTLNLAAELPDVTEEQLSFFIQLPPDQQEEVLSHPSGLRRTAIFTLMRAAEMIQNSGKGKGKSKKKELVSMRKQLSLLAALPTEMTRTSPFFPMSTQEMKSREYVKNLVIVDHSWGSIRYSGPKLSVHDEDLLLFTLAILNHPKYRSESDVDGLSSYTYKGSLREFLVTKGVTSPSGSHYTAALDSFKLMAGAVFEITTNSTKDGVKTPRHTSFSNIITGGEFDSESRDFSVTVNPYFVECWRAGSVTLLDATIRQQIKSPVAKALYRFVQSHASDRWQGSVFTVAASLNISSCMVKSKIRAHIKSATQDLLSMKLLQPGSMVNKDMAVFIRAARTQLIE